MSVSLFCVVVLVFFVAPPRVRACVCVCRQDKAQGGATHIIHQPDFSIKLPCLRGHDFSPRSSAAEFGWAARGRRG